MFIIIILIWLLIFDHIHGLPEHKLKIPNSEIVPNPCEPEKFVQSIGHLDYNGGGPLNSFGSDFESKRSWDLLCPLDSDGDGFTNGQELGDPECQWKIGDLPKRTMNITHPGVCTPIDSEICKRKHICKSNIKIQCGFNSFSTGLLIFGTLIIVLLTLIKFISNTELKYRYEHGQWPATCCPALPYDKPGFSWDK
ncbi:unnamed protein product [Schistosoma turkestanicum]|nr:unnamed protein product [Schistosoma turkestanicum]